MTLQTHFRQDSRGPGVRRGALSNTPRLEPCSPHLSTPFPAPSTDGPDADADDRGLGTTAVTTRARVGHETPWPPVLNGFGMVGQEVLAAQLEDQVAYVRATGQRFPDRLLVGPPGVGKSTLARSLSRGLVDGGCVLLSAVDCKRPAEFISALAEHGLLSSEDSGDGQTEPAIVFLDEAHGLPAPMQNWLLSATDDERAASHKGKVHRFGRLTFLLATTDPGLLSPAFLSRFDPLYLRAYTLAELAGIVWLHSRAALGGAALDRDACIEIACRMRLQPRRAVKALQNNLVPHAFSRTRGESDEVPSGETLARWLTAENVGRYFDGIGIDLNGLDGQARAMLTYLARNGIVASNRIRQALSLTADQDFLVLDEYLIRLGLVSIGARGRTLTALGQRYMRDPVSLRSRLDNPSDLPE